MTACQQTFNPSLINAAPSPVFTQAPYNAASQTLEYNTASASAVGTAAASSAVVIPGQKYRRQNTQGSSVTPSTVNIGTASSTAASASSCPTQPEAGTYCGFINPEDPCAPQPDGGLYLLPFDYVF